MNNRSSKRNIGRASFRTLIALLALHDCSTDQLWAADASAVTSTSASSSSLSLSASEGIKEDAALKSDASTSSPWSSILLEQSTRGQDPYVMASPLSVAAVCSDGVALLSLHYNVELEHSSSTPSDDDDDDDDGKSNSLASNGNESESNASIENDNSRDAIEEVPNNQRSQQQQRPTSLARKFRDLPLSTRGPLRIEPIHESIRNTLASPPPMSLLTAGWRTDGMALADAARELVMEEVRVYCLPSLALMDDEAAADDSIEAGGDEKLLEGKDTGGTNIVMSKDGLSDTIMQQQQQQHPYYGRRIAEGLSYYLSKCVFSGGVRSLSTVGLLACGTSGRKGARMGGSGGSLYLIDATGTHQVRAHAIGNGASALHRRMVFVDFETMDCQEGLRALLRLIAEEGGLLPAGSTSGDELLSDDTRKKLVENKGKSVGSGSVVPKPAFISKRSISQQATDADESIQSQRWNIPSNTGVELAVLKSGEGRMRRIRLSSLLADNHH